jgi:methanogen homocitrate synthase
MPLAMFGTSVAHGRRAGCVGKKSGKLSISYNLEKLGYPAASDEANAEMLKKVKDLGIAKRGILTDDEFREIADSVMAVKK